MAHSVSFLEFVKVCIALLQWLNILLCWSNVMQTFQDIAKLIQHFKYVAYSAYVTKTAAIMMCECTVFHNY